MERYYDNRFNDGTEAIKYELFENKNTRSIDYYRNKQADIRQRSAQEKMEKQRKTEKAKATFSAVLHPGDRTDSIIAVLLIMVGLVLVSLLVVGQAKNNDLLVEINTMENELLSLQHEYEALLLEFDTNMSKAAVEEYATTVLGMQKRESYQTHWVDLGTGDVTEYTAKRGILVQLRDWLAGLGA